MATINFYSKEQIDTKMAGMVAPTQAQLDAMNSGITSALVTQFSGYSTSKQDVLSSAQQAAVDSGITSAKVTQYDGYATSKQDKLTITLTDNAYYTMTY